MGASTPAGRSDEGRRQEEYQYHCCRRFTLLRWRRRRRFLRRRSDGKRGAIEIIIITLGTVLDQSISIQIIVVSIIALLSTIGVYGFVALLVRMDDAGYNLISASENRLLKKTGFFMVRALPVIIRTLKIVGTLAMILVGGGIFVHNIDLVHELVHGWPIYPADFVIGLTFGSVFLLVYLLLKKLFTS